jgi:hypothetical protein
MEVNDIKKTIYRLKMEARKIGENTWGSLYLAQWGHTLAAPGPTVAVTEDVYFFVPKEDMGDTKYFKETMPAQLLIRYLIFPDND